MNNEANAHNETIQTRLGRIESELEAIRRRNSRVTAEKAWEQSFVRRLTIASITYVFAAVLLWMLGNANFLLNALIPSAGYVFSTLTLPWARTRWLEQFPSGE